jgi:hypothetical protein
LADALITSCTIRTHPNAKVDDRFKFTVPASAKLAQQSVTVRLPIMHHMLQIIPKIAPLERQQRHYRVFVSLNNMTLGRSTPLPLPDDPLPMNPLVFDAQLQPGGNRIQCYVVAALPKGQKLPNGAEVEVERISILIHLLSYSTDETG